MITQTFHGLQIHPDCIESSKSHNTSFEYLHMCLEVFRESPQTKINLIPLKFKCVEIMRGLQ